MADEVIILESEDPYRCVAIEEYFIDNLTPGSSVLLFYANRQSVIYGKHQVPWRESNLG